MECKQKQRIITALAVLLFVSGCANSNFPDKFVITGVNIAFNNGVPIEDNYIFLDKLPPNNWADLVADAVGADYRGAAYTWSVIMGDIVSLTSYDSPMTMVYADPYNPSTVARIRVEAKNDMGSQRSEFNVVVSDSVKWAFAIIDNDKGAEGAEIYDGMVFIPPGGSKNISLIPVGTVPPGSVTYNWSGGDSAVDKQFLDLENSSCQISVKDTRTADQDTITITVNAGSQTLEKTLTVVVGFEPEDGVLFRWNSKETPLSGTISSLAPPVSSGYGAIRFSTRNTVVGDPPGNAGRSILYTDGGGVRLTNMSNLIIGGGADGSINMTKADRHQPGVFDLTKGTFKLTVNFANPDDKYENKYNADYFLRIYINNNTNAGANCPMGWNGRVAEYRSLKNLLAGANEGSSNVTSSKEAENSVTLTFTSPTSFSGTSSEILSTSFISILCPGSPGGITITGVELVEVKKK